MFYGVFGTLQWLYLAFYSVLQDPLPGCPYILAFGRVLLSRDFGGIASFFWGGGWLSFY